LSNPVYYKLQYNENLILESEEWNQHFVNAAGNLNMAVALKMCKWILLPLL